MKIKPEEITGVIEEQIKNFDMNVEEKETGKVLQVGDGIARVYGLENVMSGELVKFASGVQGVVLNLEEDNVGVVILGNGSTIKEGDEPFLSLSISSKVAVATFITKSEFDKIDAVSEIIFAPEFS